MTHNTPWFPLHTTPTNPGLRLFCFPHAGGSAALFRRWTPPPGIEIRPIQWPGRGERIAEPPFRRLLPMVDAALNAMRPLLTEMPYAFYGHSLGAKIAYELARSITRQNLPSPRGLYLAGCAPLDQPDHCAPLHHLSDAEFLQGIAAQGGTPQEVLECEELVRHFLPMLRADYAASETYRWQPGPPLPLPTVIFGGKDDPDAPPSSLPGWQRLISPPLHIKLLSGNHFFVEAHSSTILHTIEATALAGEISV